MPAPVIARRYMSWCFSAASLKSRRRSHRCRERAAQGTAGAARPGALGAAEPGAFWCHPSRRLCRASVALVLGVQCRAGGREEPKPAGTDREQGGPGPGQAGGRGWGAARGQARLGGGGREGPGQARERAESGPGQVGVVERGQARLGGGQRGWEEGREVSGQGAYLRSGPGQPCCAQRLWTRWCRSARSQFGPPGRDVSWRPHR